MSDNPNPMSKATMEAKAFMEEMRKSHKAKVPDGLRLLSDFSVQKVDRLGTGSILFDAILDGGYPQGHMIELFGPESSGKTTLAIHAMVEAQKTGRAVGLIDAEHTFDLQYAINLGLDPSSTVIEHPMCAEEALDTISAMLNSGRFSIIVLDSIAALAPRAEIEGTAGQAHVGLVPRLLASFCRSHMSPLSRHKTVLLLINQIREKIGVLFGNPEMQPGGRAVKFFSSVRIEVRKISKTETDDDGEAVSNRIKIKIAKNKTGMPFRTCETRIVFGKGLDINSELIEAAEANGTIIRKGAWFSWGKVNAETGEVVEERIGQGMDSVLKKLDADAEFAAAIRKAVDSHP